MKWIWLVGVWLWVGSVAVGQIPNPDSLQKRILKAKSVALDTTALPQALKDTLGKITKKLPETPTKKHSPRKAAYYSLALPGLGQVYNKQYWKVPIAGLAVITPIYFAHNFNVRYIDFLVPYLSFYTKIVNGEPVEVATPVKTSADVFVRDGNAFLGTLVLRQTGTTRNLTLDQVTQGKELYRRYRDLNIFLTFGLLALNAIEANVAAHLKTFDMSDDISWRVEPDIQANPFTGSVLGAKIIISPK
jgi:Family of unknown function (DUF5683)